MQLLFEDLETYTGESWEVWVCAYETEEPWFEEGCLARWAYDCEEEARERYCDVAVNLVFEYEDDARDGICDTLGVFLLRRVMDCGHVSGGYFTDDIVAMEAFSIV